MRLSNFVNVAAMASSLVVAMPVGSFAESMAPAPAAVHGAAGGVPNFDIGSVCRRSIDPTVETPGGCNVDEQSARDQLVKSWTQYSPAERSRCESAMTELPSYAELITCLEMMREAKTLPPE